MKYQDLMKELTARPKKTYQRGDWVAYMEDGLFTLKNRESGLKVESAVDDEWQLVPQPVTWQEAIQAWADGKTIKTQSDDGIRTYRKTSKGLQSVLGGVTKDELINGKWYVED